MRLIAERFLTCATLMLAASSVFAESPDAPRLLNGTMPSAQAGAMSQQPAATQQSVTAPAIAWPVVKGPALIEMVHMAPGSTVNLATGTPDTTAAQPLPPPEPTLVVDIDLSTQRLTVTENGMSKYTWAISSARSGYRTPTGTFKPTWTAKMWYSRQYDMAPMPHAVFFSGGVAVHATYATGMLGTPASHGCVRLAPKNAATFYALVGKHGKDMTRISVHGVPPSTGPAMASNRRRPQPYVYMSGGYVPVQYGYQIYSYSQGKTQVRRPVYQAQDTGPYAVKTSGKKLKAGRATTVASNNGFGYGFGGF